MTQHAKPPCPAQGNVLFIILIAVALLAALSFAVSRSGVSGGKGIAAEKAALDAGLSQQCTAYIEHGVNTLKTIGKCEDAQISYELANGANANPSAPPDGSCHVFRLAGAGLSPCGPWLNAGCTGADMLALSVGQKCAGADIVHAGTTADGYRIYTTPADLPANTWNNGTANWGVTGTSSDANGAANTTTLVNAAAGAATPYKAAAACRALGTEWYLPSLNESLTLYTNRNAGTLAGTFETVDTGWPATLYWMSKEHSSQNAHMRSFNNGNVGFQNKNATLRLRCIRQ